MGLKGDRLVRPGFDEISFFMNETGEKGIALIFSGTASSGAALDQSGAFVAIPTGSGGRPIGILLNDVANVDLSRNHLNFQKDETNIRRKVTILRNGWVVTNMINSDATPSAGSTAYHSANGKLTTSGINPIGTWLSGKDEDGYAKVEVFPNL